MRPFCSNKKCIYHKAEVPDDQTEIDVVHESGHSATVHRVLMVNQKRRLQHWYCEVCENAVKEVMGHGEEADPRLGLQITENSPLILPN